MFPETFRLLPLIALVLPLFGETATVEGSAGGDSKSATVTVIVDSDRDGLTDVVEATLGTDPNNPDTDGDGLTDKAEFDAGGNPLVNNFDAVKADPDWLGIPESIRTASNFSSFWDFSSQSSGFPSRKGTAKLLPLKNTNPTPLPPNWIQTPTGIWNETGGYLGKSADLGSDRYLRMDSVPTFVNYIWTASFALKLDGDPGATPVPLFGGYASQTAQAGDSFRVVLVNGSSLVSPSTNGNLLRVMVGAAGSATVTGEWLIPSSVDFKEWNEILVRVNDDNTFTNTSRHCYVNGTKLSLLVPSGGSGWTILSGSTNNLNHKAVQFGATLSATGGVTTSTQNFSLDRVYFGQGPGTAATLEALTSRDSDGDGISDRDEYLAGSDPFHYSPDVDNDGLTNEEEAAGQATFNGNVKNFGATDPSYFDSDGDLFDDYWEAKYFTSNVDPNDPAKPINDDPGTPGIIEGDYDSDGLSNYLELIHGTDPNNPDTDGDGVHDKDEADYGSSPTDGSEVPFDPSDFYGDENLGSYAPIGDLGVVLKPGDGDPSVVFGRVGDPSDSNSERWRLLIGEKQVVAQTYGELSDWTKLALDTTDFHEIKIQHVGTDPAWLAGEGNGQADYDYWAAVKPTPKSPFILCDLQSLLKDPTREPAVTFFNDVDPELIRYKTAYLIPLDTYSWAASYSGGDAVGPQHRKVALNGRPMPDDKPQQEEETDEPAEETYIDAFNLSLHHDTTFHYMPLGSSDLVLQASMSTEETGFSDRSGLRPNERFDLPFGAGWSSNLCSYVEVVETLGDESDDPVSVNVIDEAGRPQRFGTRNFQSFFPWPSTRVDKKTYLNTLTRNGLTFTLQKKFGSTLTYHKCKTWFMYSTDRLEGSTKVRRHTYWRLSEVRDRYGVRLHYKYDSEAGVANDVSLIPREISSPDRPGQFLVIERSQNYRRVESITDSRGNTTSFDYGTTTTAAPLTFSGPEFLNDVETGQESDAVVVPRLLEVTFADQTMVSYGYDGGLVVATEAIGSGDPVTTRYYHANVSSITDKRGNQHVFEYSFDDSKEYWDSAVNGTRCTIDLDRLPTDVKAFVEAELENRNEEGHGLWKRMYGLPRRVTQVDLPGGFGSSVFAPSGKVRFGKTVQVVTAPGTTVTDANDNLTIYQFDTLSAELVDVDATEKSISKEWMIYYLSSSIHHGGAPGTGGHLGTETYEFDPSSGLSLWRATDMSDNQTTWYYDDEIGGNDYTNPAIRSSLTGAVTMSRWPDPVIKIDALGRREDYTYSNSFRVMAGTNDSFGTLTTYTVDGLGRRTFMEVVNGGPGSLRQERFGYGNQRFKAFQTAKTVVAFDSVSNQAWETDLVTSYLPDTYGRLWREIADPVGEKLVTEHTYDFNNNRTSTLDARGHRTRFKYDKLNRLVEVIYPVAGTRSGQIAATKKTWYNSNGSKAAEIDEEGNYTIHHYDALNRRIVTIRDMDGLGLPTLTGNPGEELVQEADIGAITGSDLVTYFGYDSVGYLTHQTDPRGIVTRTFHDAIGRPVHVFTGLTVAEAAGNLAARTAAAAASTEKTHTEFLYTDDGIALPEGGVVKGNPGGTAFDSSGFKPTKMILHDAVLTTGGTIDLHTYASYDALYRPLRTETEYESGEYAISATTYGTIAAGKETLETLSTDDRDKVTKTVLDGLQRPVSTTDAFGTGLAATTWTVYSSTGLAWKTIDPLLRETETEYDGVARPVGVWQSDPVTGLANRNTPNDPLAGSPRTRSAYDKNNNVVVSINPLGFRWEYEYDARNRKIIEHQPTVTETLIVGGVPEEAPFQNPVIESSFDGVGNVIAVTDARGHIVRSFHDRAYRVTATLSNPVTGNPSTAPDNPGANDIVTATDFDSNGNPVEVIDGNLNATRNQYDRLNRLVATAVNPDDGQPNAPPAAPKATDIVVSNQYDDAGHLVKVTDGEGRITGFRFDGLGRKTRTLWDEGTAVERIEQAAFDGLLQVSRIDPMSRVTSYRYDALHRLEDIVYEPDINGVSSHPDNRHNDHDLVGNLKEVSYPNETASRQNLRGAQQEFDALNRLIEETSAGATHVHTYDKAGNRRTTQYAASGRTLASTYDKLNRLLTLTEDGTEVTTYGYDLNGNVTRKSLPNGSGTLSTFDALNRKLSEQTRNGGGTGGLISTFDYSQPAGGYPSGYDSVGNVLKIVEEYGHANVNNRTVTNAYDRVYRLETETIVETAGPTITTAYDHDKANNRTTKTVTGGSNPGTWVFAHGTTTDGYNSNQVKSVTPQGATSDSPVAFSYNPNGSRTGKAVNGVTDQTYQYDYENRLTGVTDSVKGTFAYSYDHRTRRVGRDESDASGTEDEVSFAAGLSVQEYLNGSATPAVEYIRGSDYGGGIGGVLYTIRGASTRSYNAYNSRGDVVSKTSQAGAITWQAAYEAFGTRTQEEGDTDDRQKANTKDEDPTGLLNEGMRYRDLEFGIFLTRDPAGFVDGPNVYTYVRQNPWTMFDPLGLSGWAVSYPQAGWDPQVRAMQNNPDYQKSYQDTARWGAAAFLAIPLALTVEAWGPAAAASLLTPGGAYTAAETVSTGAELATGYDGPPIIPGPGDAVRAAVQNSDEILDAAGGALLQSARNTMEKTVKEVIGEVNSNAMVHITTANADELGEGLDAGSTFVKFGDVQDMTISDYQKKVVGPFAAGSTSDVKGFAVKDSAGTNFENHWESGLAGVQEYQNIAPVKPDKYIPLPKNDDGK